MSSMSRTPLVLSSLLAFLCACSSSAGSDPSSTADSGSDPSTDTAFPGFDTGADTNSPSLDTGSGAHDGALADAGPSCTPKPGEDVPDDDFKDTNCDGIDGDISKAVFVAPSGVDGASGTIAAPLKSIRDAITKAASEKKSVYVCNGSYFETLTLNAASVGLVGIFGGYDCKSSWKRVADVAHVLPTSGIPLTVDSLPSALTIDRIGFTAGSASKSSESSVAVFVKDSTGAILFHNAQLVAGDGSSGNAGAAPTGTSSHAPSGAGGQTPPPTTCMRYATDNPLWCSHQAAGGSTFTGLGGGGATCAAPGGSGGKGGVLDGADRQAGIGAAFGAVSAGVDNPGRDGSDGATGTVGASAAFGLGGISSAGYVASNTGANGVSGGLGGGGSGGSGGNAFLLSSSGIDRHFCNGGGGGEGGSGGCGGDGGQGGGAGGASIGLLVKDSPNVTVSRSTLTTGGGGNGGDASSGTVGQAGGDGGGGGDGTTPGRCQGSLGGRGGRGGAGGSGGAGGGGPSFGIFWTGKTAPTASESVVFNLGAGGKGGHGRGGPDGPDGAALNMQMP